jgi:Na+-driven multidrug efflux pump
MSAIIGPFVGQNISAGKADRIYQALKLCTIFCLVSGLFIAALLAVSGSFIPSLFSDNPQVVNVAALYFLVTPISYGAYGMVMVMNASFNGMGRPMPAVWISVGRMGIIYVPLAIMLERLFGMTGIFVAYVIANVATSAVSYLWARSAVQGQCDRLEARPIVSEAG